MKVTMVKIFLKKSHAKRLQTLIEKGATNLEVPVKYLETENKEKGVKEGTMKVKVDDLGIARLTLNGKMVTRVFKVK